MCCITAEATLHGKSIAGEGKSEREQNYNHPPVGGNTTEEGLYAPHSHARSKTMQGGKSGDPEDLFQGGQALEHFVQAVLTQGMHAGILGQGMLFDLPRIRGCQDHTFQLVV